MSSKSDPTTREEFGTPWTIFPAAGAAPQHPEDDDEIITSLLDTLRPTLEAPVTLVYERTGEHGGIWHDALCVTSYEEAVQFVYERVGR